MYTKAVSFFLLTYLTVVNTQTKEGDSCVDSYTNTVGYCAAVQVCQSARQDFQSNGIRPTFCEYSAFGVTLVCCRDGSSILQTAGPKTMKPLWDADTSKNNNGKRVSDRKCEEYSRGVVEKVDFIPLLPEPETQSISSAKCDYTGVELIVGGENANQGEFPHMAAIGWTNFDGGYNFNCGGSLISSKFVMTAGHCTHDPSARNPQPDIVRLGDQNIDSSVRDGANPVDVTQEATKVPETTYGGISEPGWAAASPSRNLRRWWLSWDQSKNVMWYQQSKIVPTSVPGVVKGD